MLLCTTSDDVCVASFVVYLSKHTAKRRRLSPLAAYKPTLVTALFTSDSVQGKISSTLPADKTLSTNMSYWPQFEMDSEKVGDEDLRMLLTECTFYLYDKKLGLYLKVWWKPNNYGSTYSSWETVPEGILNPIKSNHLHNSTVQMAEVIALFGDQTPDWMKLSENDKELRQRTVNPTTVSDFCSDW